jgi:ABC-type amino acid transport substrate-binding protein
MAEKAARAHERFSPAAAVDVALRIRGCREGSSLSCAEAGVTVATAPFGYLPGVRNFVIGLVGPITGFVGDLASEIAEARGQGDGRKE